MKPAKCISISMRTDKTALSLLSYWTALFIARGLKASCDVWVMLRAGVVPSTSPIQPIPPSDSETKEVIFIGDPHEGIEFASRMKADGLSTHLFVLGVDSTTPPVTSEMLGCVETVTAYAETAKWLRAQGVEVAEVPSLPPRRPVYFNSGTPSSMQIAVVGPPMHPSAMGIPKSINARVRFCSVWNQEGTDITSPEQAWDALIQADVCALGHDFLDNPIRAWARELGLPCIPLDPLSSAFDRALEAARLRRDGVFTPLASPPPPEPFPAEVVLGIVVPFGGLDPSDLSRTLDAISRAKPKNACVSVGHYEVIGKSSEDEFDKVEELCQKHKATHVHERSDVWRMGTARNLGALGLDSAVTHVVFIDADIIVTRGYFGAILDELAKGSQRALVPYVHGGQVTRIGSGIAAYPYGAFTRVGGFNEGFEGHGFEDLEMLRRLRAKEGIPSVLVGSPTAALVEHVNHPPRWIGTSLKNFELYNKE